MQRKVWRAALLAVMLLIMTAFTVTALNNEKNLCMGVKILPDHKIEKYTDCVYTDYSNMFFHNGEMAAVDTSNFTIYISQNIDSSTRFNQLVGALKFANPNYKIYFAADEYFDKLDRAVRENHPFKLIVTDGSSRYTEYYVRFTTLPVVRMTGGVIGVNEENREVLSGDICVWTPLDPQTDSYTVKTSLAQWHVRGDSQKAQPKKPYKVALKKANGQNKDLDLVGLGSDDDWILNSMSLEDLNIRDKLVMDIWNEMCAEAEYNYPMDKGEYVEVIDNGSYAGMYLLQRRIDTKYLNTDSDDILVKGRKEFTDPNNPVYYTVVGDESRQPFATEIMDSYDLAQNYENIVLENWIDVNLFVNWAYMEDNIRRYNMYYVLEDPEDDLKIRLILWDTDMTFGLSWGGDRYIYNLWIMDHLQYNRPEYERLKEIYPDLDQRLANRWKELRQSYLSNENILKYADSYFGLFAESGAQDRDLARWGEYHAGQDSVDAFYEFIEKRMEFLDSCYGI